jgi:hypothetical protein
MLRPDSNASVYRSCGSNVVDDSIRNRKKFRGFDKFSLAQERQDDAQRLYRTYQTLSKDEARMKGSDGRTTAHDDRLQRLLRRVLTPPRSMRVCLFSPDWTTDTSTILEESWYRWDYAHGIPFFSLYFLDKANGTIKWASERLVELHKRRNIDDEVKERGFYQQIPSGKIPGYGVSWHDFWGKLKVLLEPVYRRKWQKDVAETEEALAAAQKTADSLRREILRSRIDQLEELVSNQSQRAYSNTASEPFIKARLGENEVSAFPDTGAAANFVSLQYVKSHGLNIDRKSSSLVKLGNGSTVSTLGTTTSLFSFAGEKAAHTLLFNVLRTSVYDVVLGSPFLQATETLTRYAHRIGRRCREALSHRVCALGASQRVSGRLNGIHMDATPDTGSDVSLMSASFAARHRLKINTDKHHRVLLEFADGSTARATGLVENVEWAYGDTGFPYRMDVYVLPELSVDLLLGYDFLHDTNAFVAYEGDFWSGDDVEKQAVADEVAITWLFWIIKLVRKAVKDQRGWGSRKSSSHRSFPGPHELTWILSQRQLAFFEQPRRAMANQKVRRARSIPHRQRAVRAIARSSAISIHEPSYQSLAKVP